MNTPEIDIGIPEKKRKLIAKGLSRLLADTYTLYLKTHNYHWNVTGPMFNTLHLMFEQQYNELALAVDVIAERIRAVDFALVCPNRNSSVYLILFLRFPEKCIIVKYPHIDAFSPILFSIKFYITIAELTIPK